MHRAEKGVKIKAQHMPALILCDKRIKYLSCLPGRMACLIIMGMLVLRVKSAAEGCMQMLVKYVVK